MRGKIRRDNVTLKYNISLHKFKIRFFYGVQFFFILLWIVPFFNGF